MHCCAILPLDPPTLTLLNSFWPLLSFFLAWVAMFFAYSSMFTLASAHNAWNFVYPGAEYNAATFLYFYNGMVSCNFLLFHNITALLNLVPLPTSLVLKLFPPFVLDQCCGGQYTNASWWDNIAIWWSDLVSRSCVVQPWPFYCSCIKVHSLCTSKYLYNCVTVFQFPHKIFHFMWYTTWSSVIHPNAEWVSIKPLFAFRPTVIFIVCYYVFDFYIFQYFIRYFPSISFSLRTILYLTFLFSYIFHHYTIVDIW